MAITYIVETESVTPIHIQDLKILVSKTTPVYITEAQLRSSLILTRLKSLGKVQVSEKKEARTVKQVTPTRSIVSKPATFQAPAPKGVRPPPPPAQRPAPVVPPRSMAVKKDAPQPSAAPAVEPAKPRVGRPRKDVGEPPKR